MLFLKQYQKWKKWSVANVYFHLSCSCRPKNRVLVLFRRRITCFFYYLRLRNRFKPIKTNIITHLKPSSKSFQCPNDTNSIKWENSNRTFQRRDFQVVICRRSPWAAIVEKSVWPALFLTAGRESTHSSPNLEYRHIHSWSEEVSDGSASFTMSALILALCW